MIMLLTCSNFPDELSENDELREFELSGSDCTLCLFKKNLMRTTTQMFVLNNTLVNRRP